jgi:hypothetical protein
MKKLFGLTTAALILGATAANATPIIKIRVTELTSATAAQCSAATGGAGFFTAIGSGGSCEVIDVDGHINFTGTYGVFGVVASDAVGDGSPPSFLAQAQPAHWLNTNVFTKIAGTLTIETVVRDYTMPASPFKLLATASGTVDAGMSTTVDAYFDATNGGAYGGGVNVLSAGWVGFASGSVGQTITDAIYATGYSLSWIQTVTRTLPSSADTLSIGTNSTFAAAIPAPGAIGLLGLGLVVLGAARRREAV